MGYRFRIPAVIVLVALAARTLLDAPPVAVYTAGGAVLGALIVQSVVRWARVALAPPPGPVYGDDDYKPCNATREIVPGCGVIVRCHRSEHAADEPHYGNPVDVEWN